MTAGAERAGTERDRTAAESGGGSILILIHILILILILILIKTYLFLVESALQWLRQFQNILTGGLKLLTALIFQTHP